MQEIQGLYETEEERREKEQNRRERRRISEQKEFYISITVP